ncbi:protein SRC2-like [Sesamum indicum]|uniref:Protein SRC2-like n=1 Tax=Sesamum indicum TaxID=4182 RepID=A0A6I9THA5_SESIN|nr:protein SRC2-like [Sesamum indicum]
MASRYELEVTIISAEDLKNVNWRHGKLKPYAVVWLDPSKKSSTRADEEGDASPHWNDKLLIPFNSLIDDSTLYVDVVHANAAEGTKPLIGSAKLSVRDIAENVGLGNVAERKLDLKRPSGRPQGKLQVKVTVREPRYHAPAPCYAMPYGVPPPAFGDYVQPPQTAYGSPYGVPPTYGAPPSGYPGYAAPRSYGQLAQEQGSNYGQQQGYAAEEKKKSKFGGIGTGLAVGAVAGALGGLALAEGFGALEHKIADDAADRVENDLGYDGDDY